MSNKNQHNLQSGSNITRSNERIDSTGEVFTPMELCTAMVNETPEHILKDPSSTSVSYTHLTLPTIYSV